MAENITFEEALDLSRERSVLLANGFSIAQGGMRFTYGNLLETLELDADNPIQQSFDLMQTVDFEKVMAACETSALIARAHGLAGEATGFEETASQVRENLIVAIQEVHPPIQFDIPDEQMESCAEFLNNFQSVFTLNYDLLLYWVINSQGIGLRDGFGLGDTVAGFRTFDADAYCETFYIHGALHLFPREDFSTSKKVLAGDNIVADIAATIRRTRQLPLFVAEGTSPQKESKIRANPYLRYCLESLEQASGTLFIFGHSADDNDAHIYAAICNSNISNLVFCVHDIVNNRQEIAERLARYEARRNDITFYLLDAAEVNPWGIE